MSKIFYLQESNSNSEYKFEARLDGEEKVYPFISNSELKNICSIYGDWREKINKLIKPRKLGTRSYSTFSETRDIEQRKRRQQKGNTLVKRVPTEKEMNKRFDACIRSHKNMQATFEAIFNEHEIIEWMKSEINNNDEEVKVIIRSKDINIINIPWQNEKIWNALEDKKLKNFFVGLDLSNEIYDNGQVVDQNPYVTTENPRILVILGSEKDTNNKPINIEVDRKEFEKLRTELEKRNSDIYIQIEQPSRQELKQLLQKDWDIIYYGGHSATDDDDGKIVLRDNEIAISELSEYFQTSLENKRLKLVVANSCDGIGIAKVLRNCGLPFALVMRESIPDSYAHKFLRYIIQSFMIGVPLSQTVRLSRPFFGIAFDQKYQLPGASLLPLFSLNSEHINELDFPILKLEGVNEQTLEMNALAESAKSRLTVSDHKISELELLQLYAKFLRHKNIVEDPNDDNTYHINDWNQITSQIKRDKFKAKHDDKTVIWEIDFFVDIDGQKVKWGAGFVNIETGQSELLLDTRPAMWTGKQLDINGEKRDWLKIGSSLRLPTEKYQPKKTTFTTIALYLLDEEYRKFAVSDDAPLNCKAKQVEDFGGWLKDENRKKFQREFAILSSRNSNTSEELLKEALSKVPFGRARESIGISEFDIDTAIGTETDTEKYPWRPLSQIMEAEKWDDKFCKKLIDEGVSKDRWDEIFVPDKIIIRKATRALP
ncbi:MAG: CHAT domain-containing protein [Cyanobacteria bacterium J06648_1]